ncbi:MAG: phage shock protein PspA [Geminicoccaceae bacterium]
MGFFSRMGDIVNANINDCLERAEDPGKLIRLMIEEMDETLVEVRAEAARYVADKRTIQRRLVTLEEHQAAWTGRAELALSKDREDLAKGALMEKAKLADTIDELNAELRVLDDTLAKFDEDIARLEEKLREAKAKKKSILTRSRATESRLRLRRQIDGAGLDDALVRFEQMERRLDRREGDLDALDLGSTSTMAEEIEDFEKQARIDAELDELKRKLQTNTGGA